MLNTDCATKISRVLYEQRNKRVIEITADVTGILLL